MMRSALALATAAILFAGPALAQSHAGHAGMDHAKMQHGTGDSMLTSSAPADGARLQAAPKSLRLTFGHSVVLESAVLVDGRGKRSRLAVPSASGAAHTLALPPLGRGAHTVEWRTGGGHAMQGRLRFTVG